MSYQNPFAQSRTLASARQRTFQPVDTHRVGIEYAREVEARQSANAAAEVLLAEARCEQPAMRNLADKLRAELACYATSVERYLHILERGEGAMCRAFFVRGLPITEIAAIHGTTAKVVRKTLRRASARTSTRVFALVASQSHAWPDELRLIAQAVVLWGLSIRQAAKSAQMSFHCARQMRDVVLKMVYHNTPLSEVLAGCRMPRLRGVNRLAQQAAVAPPARVVTVAALGAGGVADPGMGAGTGRAALVRRRRQLASVPRRKSAGHLLRSARARRAIAAGGRLGVDRAGDVRS